MPSSSSPNIETQHDAQENGSPVEDQIDDAKSTELSSEFVKRWSTLVSTTNWEKGRIITQWREAMIGSESPVAAYCDEAWCRRVGGVTPQHVGRLRRVYQRFGSSFATYPGIYWSHFLAALDWDDAEMWLQGAAQSNWSVSQMRRTRWESRGGDPALEPRESDLISASDDEDYIPMADGDMQTGAQDGPRSVAQGPRPDGPDFGDDDAYNAPANSLAGAQDEDILPWQDESSGPAESPFAKLPSLPVDLAEALEQFKLAIIRHRANGWAEVSQSDVQKALDALSAFAAL